MFPIIDFKIHKEKNDKTEKTNGLIYNYSWKFQYSLSVTELVHRK